MTTDTPYRPPLHFRVLRWVLRHLFRVVFRTMARVNITGLENIPAEGPYFIVFNHVSLFDPPVVLTFWPTAPEALGAADVWNRPGQNILAKLYGGIPIQRGEVDRKAMERMLQVLRAGYPLMMAPEGGRSHVPGMRPGKSGLVYLIERTHAPVIPVGITGTTDDFLKKALSGKRPAIEMKIGEAFALPEVEPAGELPKAVRQRKIDYVMARLASLLPREYRGVYAR